jgi:hypothetical protein
MVGWFARGGLVRKTCSLSFWSVGGWFALALPDVQGLVLIKKNLFV